MAKAKAKKRHRIKKAGSEEGEGLNQDLLIGEVDSSPFRFFGYLFNIE
jgi:hypothetical protein